MQAAPPAADAAAAVLQSLHAQLTINNVTTTKENMPALQQLNVGVESC